MAIKQKFVVEFFRGDDIKAGDAYCKWAGVASSLESVTKRAKKKAKELTSALGVPIELIEVTYFNGRVLLIDRYRPHLQYYAFSGTVEAV